MQLYLGDYLLSSLVQAVYSPGVELIRTELSGITTSTINDLVLFKLHKAGFDYKQPCSIGILTVGDMPQLYTTKKEGLHLKATLGLDLMCRKHENDTEYSQVMTFITKEIDFTGLVSGPPLFTLYRLKLPLR